MKISISSNNLLIPDTMVEEMRIYKTFVEYKANLIKRLNNREPGISSNQQEYTQPELYINNSIQIIPLERINYLPPQATVTKNGLEFFKQNNIVPSSGAFHGARLGRHVDIPIAVVKDEDEAFSIIDGIHRVAQALISEDKTIIAFVENGDGPTLNDIFSSVKKSIPD